MSKRKMWSPEEDAMLRALPAPVTMTARDAVLETMRAAGYNRTSCAIKDRLVHLGLSLPQRAEPWTPAENEILRQVLESECDDIVAAAVAAGVDRSAKAIVSRINRRSVPDPVAPVAYDRISRIKRDFNLINLALARVFSGQEAA